MRMGNAKQATNLDDTHFWEFHDRHNLLLILSFLFLRHSVSFLGLFLAISPELFGQASLLPHYLNNLQFGRQSTGCLSVRFTGHSSIFFVLTQGSMHN